MGQSHHRRRLPAAFVSLLLVAACSEASLTERLESCREAAKDKERLDEALGCFTASSRSLLRSLVLQEKQTGGTLTYFAGLGGLVDFDAVVGSPTYVGKLALVTVTTKAKERQTLLMVNEGDVWVLDPLELPAFWAPLDAAASEGGG